jgi:hypothetical protein
MDHIDSGGTGPSTTATELFALTDEQIVGLDVAPEPSPATNARSQHEPAAQPPVAHPFRGEAFPIASTESSTNAPTAPAWLAERMQDPHHGEEAKALWDAKQKADTEIAAYRESFATAADARALKDLYPGGLSEAQSAALRARELDAIDAAFYRGDSASRAQLAQRLMHQDPAAFREMVEAGVRLLTNTNQAAHITQPSSVIASTSSDSDARHSAVAQGLSPDAFSNQQLAQTYAQFEKAANADLEQTVGSAISRFMEDALPNLRLSSTSREAAPVASSLRNRLTSAVREEVDSALRSDQELGAQVSRILSSRRFDDSSREQVVRLIDARAQQLIPTAVKRVVSSWTQATLSAHTRREPAPAAVTASPSERANTREAKPVPRPQRKLPPLDEPAARPRRLDYSRFTDEQILGL